MRQVAPFFQLNPNSQEVFWSGSPFLWPSPTLAVDSVLTEEALSLSHLTLSGLHFSNEIFIIKKQKDITVLFF